MRQSRLTTLSADMLEYCSDIMTLLEKHNLPFEVFETARTLERQQSLIGKGSSKLLDPTRSFHVVTEDYPLADAVDFVMRENGKWLWGDDFNEQHNRYIINMYKVFGHLVKAKLGKHVIVGAVDWPRFFDGPHVQLRQRTKKNA